VQFLVPAHRCKRGHGIPKERYPSQQFQWSDWEDPYGAWKEIFGDKGFVEMPAYEDYIRGGGMKNGAQKVKDTKVGGAGYLILLMTAGSCSLKQPRSVFFCFFLFIPAVGIKGQNRKNSSRSQGLGCPLIFHFWHWNSSYVSGQAFTFFVLTTSTILAVRYENQSLTGHLQMIKPWERGITRIWCLPSAARLGRAARAQGFYRVHLQKQLTSSVSPSTHKG